MVGRTRSPSRRCSAALPPAAAASSSWRRRCPRIFITFDVLPIDGQELLAEPYERRRAILDELFAGRGLTPAGTLCPMTTDPAVAQEWLTSWTSVPGVEGLVIKGLGQRYTPGARGWFKVRRRDTTEAIVGGITGTLNRPQLLSHATTKTADCAGSAAPRR